MPQPEIDPKLWTTILKIKLRLI